MFEYLNLPETFWSNTSYFKDFFSRSLVISLVVLFGFVAYFIAKRLILRFVTYLLKKSESKWDDMFLEEKVFHWMVHLAPATVLYSFASSFQAISIRLVRALEVLALIYMIFAVLMIINSLLNAILKIYHSLSVSRHFPITGIVQLLKMVSFFVSLILALSVIINKSPFYLLSGLGALTAVFMLVFRDSLLGLVAGIHLSANRMVARGDWIDVPGSNASGIVEEVTLTTVKIQNWDKSTMTLPTYALLSDAFKNWRGMQTSGGRRIKRSIVIDLNTVKFCDSEMTKRLEKIEIIKKYMERKIEEINAWNEIRDIDASCPVNGRRLTNIGTFRAYLQAYLENHTMINPKMTLLVRQKEATQHGVPIEIYCFCKSTDWAVFEGVQSDLFDHVMAAASSFDLRVYQVPSGMDIQSL